MKELEELLKVKRGRYAGPGISFGEHQILKALMVIGEGEIGRGKLSKRLGMGEGAVRTLIKRMVLRGLVKTSARGCRLTRKGERIYKAMKEVMPSSIRVPKSGLSIDEENFALLVKGGGKMVTSGITERDEAIKAGATGATTLVFEKEKFLMPRISNNCERDHPDLIWKILREKLAPEDGDVIIIGSAKDLKGAEYGAIGAAISMLRRIG